MLPTHKQKQQSLRVDIEEELIVYIISFDYICYDFFGHPFLIILSTIWCKEKIETSQAEQHSCAFK